MARVGTGGGCWPRGWMGASSVSLRRRGDGPPYCSWQHGGLGGTSMGALLITLGDAFCPAGLRDVGDKSMFLPLPWDLPAGLDFSYVPGG